MEKNKTGKYLKYAIGEIVLVVIGILIALQINTWKETQKNTKKELAHLVGINHDLNAQVIDLEDGVKVNEVSLKIIDELLNDYVEKDGFKASDSLFYNINQLLKSPIPRPIETSFTEMLQSGEIKLIRNDSLRNSIVRFYQNLESQLEKTNQNATSVHQPIVIPVLQRNTIFDKADLINDFEDSFDFNVAKINYSDRTKSIAIKNLGIAEEELALVNALNLKAVIELIQMQRSKTLIFEANRLVSQIDKTIKKQ